MNTFSSLLYLLRVEDENISENPFLMPPEKDVFTFREREKIKAKEVCVSVCLPACMCVCVCVCVCV